MISLSMKSSYGKTFELMANGCYFCLLRLRRKKDVSLRTLVVDCSCLHFLSNFLLNPSSYVNLKHFTTKLPLIRVPKVNETIIFILLDISWAFHITDHSSFSQFTLPLITEASLSLLISSSRCTSVFSINSPIIPPHSY